MLKIKNLKVKTKGKKILDNINLEIPKGKVYILFGPNGSGKTTLLMTILGIEKYKSEGKIIFKNKDISNLPPNERAKMGIGISFQRPPTIDGLNFENILDEISPLKKEEREKIIKKLKFKNFLKREINKGMSGGEIKRGEIFQLLSQDPDLLLIDEPESGVDIENIGLIGNVLRIFLKKKKKSALIITHSGAILKYIPADRGFVMVDGKIICSGDPKEILKTIKRVGYRRCVDCYKKHPN